MKRMTCREFDEVVHEFVRMDLLDVSVREAALEHAAHCELCSQRMADATALAESLDSMRRSMREDRTPPQVESALLAAFRNYHRRASWRRTLEWTAVGAAAAVLLIFLWTAGGRSKGPASPAQRKDVSSESQSPQEAKAPVATQQEQASASIASSATALAETDTYSASDFVPVPFSGTISADDPGMVVRVQLTRASLAELGYPVAETPDEDLISADVLVGEDGWPRGVKLIQ
jgi:hypothetical protein